MWVFIRLLLIVAIIGVLEFYFFKRFTGSLKTVFSKIGGKKYKRILYAVLLYVNLYPLFVIGFGIYYAIAKPGSLQQPENILFDIFILFPFWAFILIMVQSGLLFLLIDIPRLVLFPLYKKYKERLRPLTAKLVLFIAAASIIYVPVRILYDYYHVSLRVVEYKKAGLPESLNGFKLVMISDIHADRYTNPARLDRFMSVVNSTNPDMVLIGGDFISTGSEYIDLAADEVGKIKSKYGVYTCVGDHDNWAYQRDYARSRNEITEALQKKNVFMIDDQNRDFKIKDATIHVTFVTNTYVESIPQKKLDTLAQDSLKRDLKILLVHQPRQFLIDKAIKDHYDLMLAGHTHGGQITFLFPFMNLSPTQIETPYVRGDFHFGNMLMIITRGLGMSLAPVRYNSTPEVTLIILSNK